jgi:hypothetical protein
MWLSASKPPVVATGTPSRQSPPAKRWLYIDCGEKNQFRLALWRSPVRAATERTRHCALLEEFPDNHTIVDYRMDESLPFSPTR